MKLNNIFFFSIVLFTACSEPTHDTEKDSIKKEVVKDSIQNESQVSNTEFKLPPNYIKIMKTFGDLDKDGIDEIVVVCENGDTTSWGPERELQVYRKEGENWKLWHNSVGAILGEEEGGMMGDPFMNVYVENGAIVTEHFGGSRDKWSYTHRYRFQHDRWELIGATVNYGSPCESWDYYDYNLSTGKVNVKIVNEICDESDPDIEMNEEIIEDYSFIHKMDTLPYLGDFQVGNNSVRLPEDKGGAFYF